tara:strand:- start:438 stop:884 length:447 start_codon:yes stop_codon:yes gene_type:complete
MGVIHCKECEKKGKRCGGGHVYVVQLNTSEMRKKYPGDFKGYLYVGKTGKTVHERWLDNYRREGDDENPVDVDEARESFDDPGWKRPGPSGKLIRQYYWRHRPEKYVGWNPIPRESGRRRDVVLDEKERRMKARLEKKGWWVKGPKVD